jgi:hypothetical protein
VSGKTKNAEENTQYLYRGIAGRAFEERRAIFTADATVDDPEHAPGQRLEPVFHG